MAHPFLEQLARGPMLGDGAMGTMLYDRGARLDQCLDALNEEQPEWVREVHLAYIRAGAEVIQTNTFGASAPRLADCGLEAHVREINFRGVKLAREAREISGQSVWLAGSVGPLGKRVRRGDELLAELAGDGVHRAAGSTLGSRGRSHHP